MYTNNILISNEFYLHTKAECQSFLLGSTSLIINAISYVWHNLVADGVNVSSNPLSPELLFSYWGLMTHKKNNQVKYIVVVFIKECTMTKYSFKTNNEDLKL